MKAYGVNTGISPFFPDLGTKWVGVISFTCRPLYTQRMIPRFPLYRRLGGFSVWSGHFTEETTLMDFAARSLVGILTAL
jgi:hypothetical protein